MKDGQGSFHDTLRTRQLDLGRALLRMSRSELENRSIHPFGKTPQVEGPATFTMPYRTGVARSIQYYEMNGLQRRVIEEILTYLDREGLLGWVRAGTTESELIHLALNLPRFRNWYLSPSGLFYQPIHAESLEQPYSELLWNNNVFAVGWAWQTPWWDLVRLVMHILRDRGLVLNMAEMELEGLLDATTKKPGKFDPELIEEVFGLPEEEAERELAIERILKQSWAQDWFPKAIRQADAMPEGGMEVLDAYIRADHPGAPDGRLLRSLLEQAQCLANERWSDPDGEPYTDEALSPIVWGVDHDELARAIEERLESIMDSYQLTVGVRTMRYHDGLITINDDLDRFVHRCRIRNACSTWMHQLMSYTQQQRT